jgi:hypothetical protein
MASLQTLPVDVFQDTLLSYLTFTDVCNLGATSKSLHSTISTQGTWTAFLRWKNYHDITQGKSLSALPVRLRAAIGRRADLGWENRTFKSNNLFPQRWQRTCLPRLEISQDFIVVGIGSDLHVHWIPEGSLFRSGRQGGQVPWTVYNLGQEGKADITEIISVPGKETEFIVGQAHGLIRHLAFSKKEGTFEVKKVFEHPTAVIRCLAKTDEYLVALSSTAARVHLISFYPLTQSESEETPINSESTVTNEEDPSHVTAVYTTPYFTRPWQSTFMDSTTLAVGSMDPNPLSIATVLPSSSNLLTVSRQLCSYNSCPVLPVEYSINPNRTSVEALFKYSPHVLLSGWWHGPANLHDLRLPSPFPVTSFNDPMDETAAYSLSTDGAHRILVGASNHAIVKIFDVRFPRGGWSVYLGRDRSPVYALRGEHSRFYAATEGMLWECDFSHRWKEQRSGWGWGRRREGGGPGGHVRVHFGEEKDKLFREDGSKIGRAESEKGIREFTGR